MNDLVTDDIEYIKLYVNKNGATALESEEIVLRNSKSRRNGSLFPLYWSGYQENWITDNTMPEDKWKKNIDWVAEHLLPYGYNMITNDGWLEGSTQSDEHGYLLKYDDSWEHGWDYWQEYMASKGLAAGVYYNPLWVSPAAAADPTKKVIGTDIPLSAITSSKWADPGKEGAREYIQGYVAYFKDMGYRYIRLDFLSWFEAGTDAPEEVTFFGHEAYGRALRWIHEAAGDDMEVSYVMNNSWNHALHERTYGDLLRIANDTADGGWTSLNHGGLGDERQIWQNKWPQWANIFQGFTGFSDISGRGNICLDGDFLCLNTFHGDKADAEKKVMVSLFTMAGSPLAASDQFDMEDNLAYYTNGDILELKKEGFTGKPFYYNEKPFEPQEEGNADTKSRDPERWLGQCTNGDWVVALFNRTEEAATRSIDFEKDLGLLHENIIHDLWEHTDERLTGKYELLMQPHTVKMIRIKPDHGEGLTRYEAEMGAYQGGAGFYNQYPHSGMGYIGGFVPENPQSGVLFSVHVVRGGSCQISIRYANASGYVASAVVQSEDLDGNLVSMENLKLPSGDSWTSWRTVNVIITLAKGINMVTIRRGDGGEYSFHLDYIDVKEC